MFPSRTSQSIILVVPDDHEYKVPVRGVKTPQDMPLWERSEAYSEYLGFILTMNESIKGKALSVECTMSPNVQNIVGLLDKVSLLINEIPPIDQPQRFGNQSFRTWYHVVKDKTLEMLQAALPELYYRAIPEVQEYFIDGFGNSTRIDYGTGHELSFLMFLCCLFKIGAFCRDDNVAVVTRIFPKYLEVARKLQQTYRMEPAGSHGVWSLDDYQFVPFIFGSAQLIAHPKIDPTAFLNKSIIAEYAKEYMFLGCIEYINKVKTGPFAEHSNQLWGISAVNSWTKINSGLIKMYKAEILSKFPVAQHIVFGSLLPFKAMAADATQSGRLSLSTLSGPASKRTSLSSGLAEEAKEEQEGEHGAEENVGEESISTN